LLHADQVASGEDPHALPERGTADTELARELVLGADPIAWLQAAALDICAELSSDLLARVRPEPVEASSRRRRLLARGPAHGTSTARPRIEPARSSSRTSLTASSGWVCTTSRTRPAACSSISSHRSIHRPTRLATTDCSCPTSAPEGTVTVPPKPITA